MITTKEFDEIRPYEAEEMKQAFNDLLNEIGRASCRERVFRAV